ncbi:hypothetical protein ACTHUM_13375, partial [Neisseria sp. P0021.S006]|uniref:hypothetical protein n=1 Tax=Neisseria sp. P0021.S006 TaxID=3436821 RepID=UPI003F7E9F69
LLILSNKRPSEKINGIKKAIDSYNLYAIRTSGQYLNLIRPIKIQMVSNHLYFLSIKHQAV